MSTTEPVEIGILIYEGAQMAAVLGLTDLLTIADALAQQKQGLEKPLFRVTHWAKPDQSHPPQQVFASSEGVEAPLAVLVLPPALGDPIEQDQAQVHADWLKQAHQRGATLASVCGGALILGETGLLDGRAATTHWAYDSVMRSRFPKVSVDTDRLIIDDGDIVTAGGLMSWTDLGLKLVDRFLGPTVMIETARQLLVDPPGREQRFYSIFSPKLTHGDAAVLKVQHWLQATDAKETSLTALAAQAGLEERTFLRRFQRATGLTSTEYVQRLRVSKAQELLQFSTETVDRVAWQVGYGDPSAFRKIFIRVVGLTPNEFRRRFRA